MELGPIAYSDLDGDGDDVLVVLRCTFAGAAVDTSASLQALRLGADGGLEQLGDSRLVEPVGPVTATGVTVAVDRDVYAAGDAQCCPSSGVQERWRFEGGAFALVGSVEIPPPGGG